MVWCRMPGTGVPGRDNVLHRRALPCIVSACPAWPCLVVALLGITVSYPGLPCHGVCCRL